MTDLRLAVLVGIDRLSEQIKCEVQGIYGPQLCPCPGCISRKALRHLREIVERHRFVPDDDETEGGDWCDECAVTWPCPFLLSLAPDYAPQALAKMEVDRG